MKRNKERILKTTEFVRMYKDKMPNLVSCDAFKMALSYYKVKPDFIAPKRVFYYKESRLIQFAKERGYYEKDNT